MGVLNHSAVVALLRKKHGSFSLSLPPNCLDSAIDGWGFGLDDFVDLYSKKLNVNAKVIRKTLWGDFFLNAKTKKIQKGATMKAKKPLFVQV